MEKRQIPDVASRRLQNRLESLRGEKIIVPDWRTIGLRAIAIGILFGVWLLTLFGILAIPRIVSDIALAGSAFLVGVNFVNLTDQRLWLSRSPVDPSTNSED